jgi:16S rRNA (uracil1498-N3)-methyltransferase
VNWTDAAHIAVGPEGGFGDDELSAATNAGWQLVSLGPRILRTETAAVILTGMAGVRNADC